MALDDETIDEVGATYLRLDGDVTVDVGGIHPRITGERILEPVLCWPTRGSRWWGSPWGGRIPAHVEAA